MSTTQNFQHLKSPLPACANVFQGKTEIFEMMDSLPFNIMYCDTDLIIKYANPSSYRTLKGLESFLPIPLDKIVGSKIDVFHKDPSYQQKLLANPKNLPHRAKIKLASEILDLNVQAVYDAGNYVGVMLSWDVVTEKLKADNKNTQYESMLENIPINVMLSNTDFNIVFVNPTSRNTLKSIEKLLPCRADDLLGKSIDIFHKNPAYQRKILSNPNNLPHKAVIKLGEESLDLLVTGVYDSNKQYQGAMLTWEVITQRLKMEESKKQIMTDTAQMISDFVKNSSEIASKASEVAKGAQGLGATTEEMNATVEELTASINSIAQNSKGADTIARTTHQEAETGAKLILKAIESMELISKSSEDISEIVKIISEIAGQTNLLAFNAAIEAARAGEHGLGFSVVADEVRKLAERSSQATKEITKLISESVKRIAQGSEVSKQAGDAFQKIVAGVTRTTQSISEIASATEEQLIASKEVSTGIQQVATETERSATASEAIATAIKALQDKAVEYQKKALAFK
jgi:methyl-accepting chemotaxis protein